jgi:hypothetical protein
VGGGRNHFINEFWFSTAGLTLFCNNSTNSFLFYFVFRKSVLFAKSSVFDSLDKSIVVLGTSIF